MITVDTSSRDKIPLNEKQFRDVLMQISDRVDKKTLKEEEALVVTHIFDVKDTENFTDGFQITLHMTKDKDNNTGIHIKEMLIFENDDEWLDAFNVLKIKDK